MRLLLGFLLAMLSPAMALADIAGNWAGEITFPNGPQRVIFHVTGPDSALKATWDSPELNHWGYPVPKIALSGPTFSFSLISGASFSGDLMADGTINGTWQERGLGFPLVLRRTEDDSRPAPVATGSMTDRRYHNDYTGIEFILPDGFSAVKTTVYAGNGGVLGTTLLPREKAPALQIAAWMDAVSRQKKNLDAVIDLQIPAKIKRRKDATNNYRIPAETIQKVTIGGQPAVKATAYLESPGTKQAELLTWITSTHAIVHFYAFVPVDELPDFQWRFDQLVNSAIVP